MSKNPNNLDDIDDNLDKFFHVDDNEIDDLIKQAEEDLKNKGTEEPEEKKKTKKKKKSKKKREKRR